MVTQSAISRRVVVLRQLHDVNISIDWTSGRPRIQRDGRNISPRLARREMMTWLEGFESGLESAVKVAGVAGVSK
jgi:hypothetical protein